MAQPTGLEMLQHMIHSSFVGEDSGQWSDEHVYNFSLLLCQREDDLQQLDASTLDRLVKMYLDDVVTPSLLRHRLESPVLQFWMTVCDCIRILENTAISERVWLFWETVAVKVLQPPQEGLQDYIAWLEGVRDILPSIVLSLHESGLKQNVVFLAHTELAAAMCILFLLQHERADSPLQPCLELLQVRAGIVPTANNSPETCRRLIEELFQTVTILLQSPCLLSSLALAEAPSVNGSAPSADGSQGRSLFQWICQWRRPDPVVCDFFDAGILTILLGVAGVDVINPEEAPGNWTSNVDFQNPTHQALLQVFLQEETSAMFLRALLNFLESTSKGIERAFEIFRACTAGRDGLFLVGSSELLMPESIAALAVRLHAVRAMQENFESFTEGGGNSEAQTAAHVGCPAAVLHLICFTLTNDPSVRMRRAAMSLLQHVKVQGDAQERELMHTLALKCRDKDRIVRQQAFELLTARPGHSLLETSIKIWRTILQQMFREEEEDQESPAETLLRKIIFAAVDKGTLPQTLEELGICTEQGLTKKSLILASSAIRSRSAIDIAQLLETLDC